MSLDIPLEGGPYHGKRALLRGMQRHGDSTLPFRTASHNEAGRYVLDCGGHSDHMLEGTPKWNPVAKWKPCDEGWLGRAIAEGLQKLEGWP